MDVIGIVKTGTRKGCLFLFSWGRLVDQSQHINLAKTSGFTLHNTVIRTFHWWCELRKTFLCGSVFSLMFLSGQRKQGNARELNLCGLLACQQHRILQGWFPVKAHGVLCINCWSPSGNCPRKSPSCRSVEQLALYCWSLFMYLPSLIVWVHFAIKAACAYFLSF